MPHRITGEPQLRTPDPEEPVIRRGVFTSVKDLNAKIRQFITGWNDRKHPFVWTKTPEEILAKANLKPTSETRH